MPAHYGGAEDPDHDTFTAALTEVGLSEFVLDKAEAWLRRCTCKGDDHAERCEVGLVIRNCDTFGQPSDY